MKNEALDYLYSLKQFSSELKLERMQQLMTSLNHPHNKYKTVHIAGTNGKGSTATFLANILKEAGYKVGLYTSPHLVKFNERIKVNMIDVSDDELISLIEELRGLVEKNEIDTTFFELTTALAFIHFAREDVDFAVIEVGLGGRLDATNVINPVLSVITNISLDHTKILGSNIIDIAKEKAEIIKQSIPVVTAERNREVLDIFRQKCKETSSELHIVDVSHNEISLLGDHQQKNASTAIFAANFLKKIGFEISSESVSRGVNRTKWPGRLEIVSRNPFIMVDCAHNVAGMKSLVEYIKNVPNRRVLILGFSSDKEFEQMVELVAPLFETVIVTEGNYKPLATSIISSEVKKYTNVQEIANVGEALKKAITLVGDDLCLVTGSIYMVGDALKQLRQPGIE